MSLFGGASRQTKEEELAMEMHMEGTLKVFNNMSRLCFKKCIPNFHEAELNVAEYTCIDRCSAKFMQCNEAVTKVLNEVQQEQMKMQQSILIN